MIFAIWLEMRGTLWLEPLKIVTRPTVINSSSATKSWLSICAVRMRVMRLITGGLRVVFFGFDRRRLFAEQVVIEYLARDGRGGARAKAGVLDQHSER